MNHIGYIADSGKNKIKKKVEMLTHYRYQEYTHIRQRVRRKCEKRGKKYSLENMNELVNQWFS